MKNFDYSLDYKNLDLRKHPELYAVGKGEQGVLLVEPYNSELLPYWRFRTPELAKLSSEKIYTMFLNYLEKNDFVGADMARKYLQMGFTRARRYANHKGGRKYEGPVPEGKKGQSGSHGRKLKPQVAENPEKEASAKIYIHAWDRARNNSEYLRQKENFKKTHQ